MKVNYNLEREEEDKINYYESFCMFYNGFFTCLKEISRFIDALEMRETDLEK